MVSVKIIKAFVTKIFRKRGFNSQVYWEDRYSSGGNSGAGSYGKLASYKAQIINDFVIDKNINSVIELGCGDGNQLKLAKYKNYIGLDVSKSAIEQCKEIFKNDKSKTFIQLKKHQREKLEADLVLSLDVIFHLVEDKIFEEYMSKLFGLSSKYVIIYSSNYEGSMAKHVRSRRFTEWVEKNKNHFCLISKIPNIYPFDPRQPHETSISDFYVYKKSDEIS